MITDQIAVREQSGRWKFTWSPGAAPYSVWLEGVEVTTDLLIEEYEYDGADFPDVPPPLEILEAGDIADNETYPPRALVQWYGNPLAVAYEVEQKIDGVFTLVVAATERGDGYYSWTSLPLDDVTTHEFRVKAIDSFGNEGPLISFSVDIVRNPPAPDVTVAVSAGDIVVSATP